MPRKIIILSFGIVLLFLVRVIDVPAISSPYVGERSIFFGGDAGIGINGSVHDLRRANISSGPYESTPPDSLDRICIFCHAPHHTYRPSTAGAIGTGPLATADATYLPLWNHTITQQVFTPYYNGPDAPLTGPKQAQSIEIYGAAQGCFDRIGAASLLCLSCHDGTIAVNIYGERPQNTKSISYGGSMVTFSNSVNIGSNGYLANHHPIGFLFDTVSALDMEIYNSEIAVFDQTFDGGNNVIPVSNFLWNGKMECPTCHSVHNVGNTGEKLLRVSDRNSNLCLSCHAKGQKTTVFTP